MNDSESQACVTLQEIRFLQQYSSEQMHFLGQHQHSPATVWLHQQGLTNLDVGRFVLALAGRRLNVPLIMEEPMAEFQSPWTNRDEFLNRLEKLTT